VVLSVSGTTSVSSSRYTSVCRKTAQHNGSDCYLTVFHVEVELVSRQPSPSGAAIPACIVLPMGHREHVYTCYVCSLQHTPTCTSICLLTSTGSGVATTRRLPAARRLCRYRRSAFSPDVPAALLPGKGTTACYEAHCADNSVSRATVLLQVVLTHVPASPAAPPAVALLLPSWMAGSAGSIRDAYVFPRTTRLSNMMFAGCTARSSSSLRCTQQQQQRRCRWLSQVGPS